MVSRGKTKTGQLYPPVPFLPAAMIELQTVVGTILDQSGMEGEEIQQQNFEIFFALGHLHQKIIPVGRSPQQEALAHTTSNEESGNDNYFRI